MPPTRKTSKVLQPPAGFEYDGNIVTAEEESALVGHIRELDLKEFEFHGFYGKRRTTSFGWHYSFGDHALQRVDSVPDWLTQLRLRAATFAGLGAEELPHVLVTEYTPGTPIGWHRDRDVFGDVIGVSLLSPCVFRFRRRTPEAWERHSLILNPRSIYLLRGPARNDWEHSIPEVKDLRYSITFRSLR